MTPASDHSAVIVPPCLIFSSARAAPHNVMQQGAVDILLVLCWPDFKAAILIMVYRLGLDFSNGPCACFALPATCLVGSFFD